MIDLNFNGIDALARRIERLGPKARDAAMAQLRTESEQILADAKDRCPVGKTGRLRNSGRLVEEDLRIAIVFGGPTAPYARAVHEDMEDQHDNGQAKFLESAATTRMRGLGRRVAAAIKEAV